MKEVLKKLEYGRAKFDKIVNRLNVHLPGSGWVSKDGIYKQIQEGLADDKPAFIVYFLSKDMNDQIQVHREFFTKIAPDT